MCRGMIKDVNVFLFPNANIRWQRLNLFSILQALFEIIASEAIYVNRLHILITVFYEAKEFSSLNTPEAVISAKERKDIFLNIRDIWDVATEWVYMITSSTGGILRVTEFLWGEFTGPRWIPLTKTSDAELRYFLWSVAWTNRWVNNLDAGDFRRHRAHNDVIVMIYRAYIMNE